MLIEMLLAVALFAQVDGQSSKKSEATNAAPQRPSATDAAPTLPDDKASTVSISGTMRLDELCASLEKQTGNKIVDYRQKLAPDAPTPQNPQLKLEIKNAPFWKAFDAVLDSAQLGIYQFSGKDGLAFIDRPADELPRTSRATYAGPLRLEPLRLMSQREFSVKRPGLMKLELEIAWEPRITPIAIAQTVADLKVVDDQGEALKVEFDGPTLEAEVKGGSAAQIYIPFAAPARSTNSIASVKGSFNVLMAGPLETFEFDKLSDAAKPNFHGVEKKKGGVTVAIDQVRKNNEVWEVLMRVRCDDGGSIASRADRLSQNEACLRSKDNQILDSAGFHTTIENKNELGMAYQFELPDNPEGYTFVYKTPSSFHSVPIPFELKNLALP